jgi:hypothetical protein
MIKTILIALFFTTNLMAYRIEFDFDEKYLECYYDKFYIVIISHGHKYEVTTLQHSDRCKKCREYYDDLREDFDLLDN